MMYLSSRMSFEDLTSLLDDVSEVLIIGDKQFDEFEKNWMETVLVSGWSIDEFESEIDRRWTLSSSRKTMKQLSPNN